MWNRIVKKLRTCFRKADTQMLSQVRLSTKGDVPPPLPTSTTTRSSSNSTQNTLNLSLFSIHQSIILQPSYHSPSIHFSINLSTPPSPILQPNHYAPLHHDPHPPPLPPLPPRHRPRTPTGRRDRKPKSLHRCHRRHHQRLHSSKLICRVSRSSACACAYAYHFLFYAYE